jgi:GT2 family glycosyltransferase
MVEQAILPAGAATDPFQPIRLLEVELADEVKPISLASGSAEGRYASAVALVRLHGEPLGTVFLRAPDGMVMPAELISAINAALADRIASHLEGDGMATLAELDPYGAPAVRALECQRARRALLADPPLVSVVVATHDRPLSLTKCLNSLMRLDYPCIEVIVVRNGIPQPTEEYDRLRAKYAGNAPVRWLDEPVPGACRARNLGISAARGDFIAFCDDDVRHDPNWISELVLGFDAGDNVGCVTGLAYPEEIETPSQLWFEQYGGFGAGFRRQIFDLGDHRPDDPLFPYRPAVLGVGTNMAFRSHVIRQLGGFNPALGPGTPIAGGEDYALYYRALLRGFQIAYRPSAIVYHRHRQDYESLRAQVFGYGAGYAASLVETVLAHPPAALSLARRLPQGIAAFVRAKLSDRHQPTYPAELARIELRGLLQGPGLLLLSKLRASTVRGSVASTAWAGTLPKNQEMTRTAMRGPDRRASQSGCSRTAG